MNKKIFLAAASTCCVVTAAPAMGHAAGGSAGGGDDAQVVGGGAAPQASSTASAGEIIVTANKREQRLNDVGQTISVLGSSALKEQQITSMADIAQSVPGLSFTSSQTGTPVYTLRGVGFNDSSLAAYPTVSVYIDQAPLQFGVLAKHSAFDLERIEVLKGPQGTLFGQNSTGGAINYIAAKPAFAPSAGIDITYGRFNQANIEAYVSGPITDTLRARIAGRVESRDGWQKSLTRPDGPDRTNGKVENYMGRLLVDFEPSDVLSFQLNVNGWKEKSDPVAPQYTGLTQQLPEGFPALLATPFTPDDPRAADWTPGLIFADNSMWQATLRADLELGGNIVLTSLSAYTDYDQRQGQDTDGVPFDTLDNPMDKGGIDSFFQELRLSNGSAPGVRWVLGANLEHTDIDQERTVRYFSTSTQLAFNSLGYRIRSAADLNSQKKRNYAVFGNVEFDATSRLTLKAGARYTKAKAETLSCSLERSGTQDDTGAFIFDIVVGGIAGEYQPGLCYAVNDLGEVNNGVQPGTPGEFAGTLDEDNLSWRVGADYKLRPDFLLYANVSKGYKAGSFPVLSPSTFSQYLPVRQESILAYEAGIKVSLLDRALQLNAAGFYYDYSDKQLMAKERTPIYGILNRLQNIPKSSIKGFELEATARPTGGLVVSGAFTWLDATIDEYVGINGAGLEGDFSGARIPFTPKYQVSMKADYTFAVSDGLDAYMGAGIDFRSGTTAVIGGDENPPGAQPEGKPLYRIDDYALVDLRAGIRSPDGWRVGVFGKNIFNTYYWTNVAQAVDVVARYPGMGATYGIQLGYDF